MAKLLAGPCAARAATSSMNVVRVTGVADVDCSVRSFAVEQAKSWVTNFVRRTYSSFLQPFSCESYNVDILRSNVPR